MSYAAARTDAALIERTDRAVTRMHGRDPLRMIQGLVTNDVAGAPPNTPVYAAFLTPKGKMIGDARVIRRADNDVWIEADVHALANIEAHLKRSVPPLFARAERLTDVRVVGVYGPRSLEVKIASELQLPTSYAGVTGVDHLVRGETTFPDLPRLDFEQLEVLRIEAGAPRWGAELTEDVIPLEAGLRDVAISETKGCYTGQEIIIRILHRGHVNRHLRGLLLGSAEVPGVPAEIIRPGDGKIVGSVTSACASTLLQQTIALGYVRREVTPGETVTVGGAAAMVVELPFQKAEHEGVGRVRSA
ncbi:MAG TPA: glycine cleavage T C-terminal barrel domain-containing protein [Longimicrobiales bacterium]